MVISTAGGSSIDSTADRYTYVSADGGGGGPGEPPRLWALKLSPSTFAAAGKGPSASAAAVTGATVTYLSSEAVHAKLTVQRRSGNRYLRVPGVFRRATLAGLNSFRFSGRLEGKPCHQAATVSSPEPSTPMASAPRRSAEDSESSAEQCPELDSNQRPTP